MAAMRDASMMGVVIVVSRGTSALNEGVGRLLVVRYLFISVAWSRIRLASATILDSIFNGRETR